MMLTRRSLIQQAGGAAVMVPQAWASLALAANAPALAKSPLGSAALRALEADLRRYVDSGARAGISWAVSHEGRLVSAGAYGYRDLAARARLTPSTLFRIYSMTRAMTAAGGLALVERGAIAMSDPIARYLPEFTTMSVLRSTADGSVVTEPAARPILVRDLFTYTAGFGYAQDYPASLNLKSDDVMGPNLSTEQGIRRLAALPLLHQPGAKWHYGWAGDVLGRLIEVVSGQRLDEYFATTLLGPLGMRDSVFVTTPDRLSRIYGPAPTGEQGIVDVTEKVFTLGSWLSPGRMHSGGGGLLSTSLEYLRFCEMLMGFGERGGVRVLRASTVAQMLTNQLTAEQGPLYWYQKDLPPDATSGQGWGYGIGLRLAPSAARPYSVVGEAAWGGLAGTGYFLHPRRRLSAVVMTQWYGPGGEDPTATLRRGVYGADLN